MASVTVVHDVTQAERSSTSTIAVAGIALTIAVIHLLTNSRYGFHRDELQILSDALHLDWGFVPYPPLTPFLERISLGIFGISLVGLRVFSVLAQSAAIIVTGLMARELGGGRWAQAAAALGVAVSPLSLFEGTEFQYTTFDYLWWVLVAYFVIRLLKTDNPRWCLAIGSVVGVGLMTKYTMAFFVAGILLGLVLTRARRYLTSRWLWAGVGLAFLIFLPNLVWQVRHDFISPHFLQYIHARDVGEGRAEGFWQTQFLSNANRYAAPLWIAGLIGFLLSQRYRMLAWTYLSVLLVFWLTKGHGYYVGAAYPMLMAMGGTIIEGLLLRLPLPRLWRGTVQVLPQGGCWRRDGARVRPPRRTGGASGSERLRHSGKRTRSRNGTPSPLPGQGRPGQQRIQDHRRVLARSGRLIDCHTHLFRVREIQLSDSDSFVTHGDQADLLVSKRKDAMISLIPVGYQKNKL